MKLMQLEGSGKNTNVTADVDEREQTLNQLLSLMDGFDDGVGVIVMGATNRLDVLDRALIRPGRFDRIIAVGMPNLDGRVAVLKLHLRGKDLETELNLREVAYECGSFSGSS